MKIATYRPKDTQQPTPGIGAVVGNSLIDLHYAYAAYLGQAKGSSRPYEVAAGSIPRDMMGFLQGGDASIDEARRSVDFVSRSADMRGLSGERLTYKMDEIRLLAPLARPGKILAAGKNYADHAAEGAKHGEPVKLQPFPRGFVKVSSAVVGPDDPVDLAPVTTKLDYEVELAVIVGKQGRYISKARAYDYIAGYTILNDVSARDIQLAEAEYGNHMMGKNLDTLSPMGPWIVTRDEMPDPMNIRVQLKVNGRIRQDASTSTMIHDIPAMMERWSWGTLEPGDVIATGTPAGVALSGKEPYLVDGDEMECIVEGIGSLKNRVVAGKAA